MNLVNCTLDVAEDGLLQLARHVPTDIPIGRPLTAIHSNGHLVLITTEAGFWWPYPGYAERLDQLPDGRTELAVWRAGIEMSRFIAPVH